MRLVKQGACVVALQGAKSKPQSHKRIRAWERPSPKAPVEELMRTEGGQQRFYHARSHMPMHDEEVKALFEDPGSMPDSDDDENLAIWKV